MSQLETPTRPGDDPSPPPPLENGDRLDRDEFERRYRAMPHVQKAELLRGIVFKPSPVNLLKHGEPHFDLVTWLGTYKLATPGLHGGDNATVRLGQEDEPQPDALLMIAPGRGGQATVGEDGYLEGPPELAVEVTSSTASYDLHIKLEVYREHGIREYVVWRVRDRAVDWFVLRAGRHERLAAGPDGILRGGSSPASGSTRRRSSLGTVLG